MEYSLIFVFDKNMDKVLLVKKIRGPYPNCFNGVGGKIEPTDNSAYDGAIRELFEETDLVKDKHFDDIHFLAKETFNYGVGLHVFFTIIDDTKSVVQKEDEILCWKFVIDILKFPDELLAGEGNVKHFIMLALKERNNYYGV